MKLINSIIIISLFISILGCTSSNSKFKGDSTMEYTNAEQLFQAISSASKDQRDKAIKELGSAYTSTNRSAYQRKLLEMPDQLIIAALSHPYKDNKQAQLWFGAVESLIELLKTKDREAAGVVLPHIGLAPNGPNYDVWKKKWPMHKAIYIQVMNQKSN